MKGRKLNAYGPLGAGYGGQEWVWGRFCNRQFDRNSRAVRHYIFYFEVPATLLDDSITNAQSESGSFARRLRRIERVESAVEIGKTRAGIFDLDDGSQAAAVGANADLLAAGGSFKRVTCVVEQVEEDLFDLVLAHCQKRQVGCDVEIDANVPDARVVFTKREHLLHDGREIDGLIAAHTLSRKAKQVVDNPVHAAGFADQLRQLIASVRCCNGIVDQLAISHDRGQGIVEFMGDSGQQLAHGCQFFRADELLMQGLEFDGQSNVGGKHFDVRELERMNRFCISRRSQPDAAQICAAVRAKRDQYFFAIAPSRVLVLTEGK